MRYIVKLQDASGIEVNAIMQANSEEEVKKTSLGLVKSVAQTGKSKIVPAGVVQKVVSCEIWEEKGIKVLTGDSKFSAIAITKTGAIKEAGVSEVASLKSAYAKVLKESKLKDEDMQIVIVKAVNQKPNPSQQVTESKPKESKEGNGGYRSPVYDVKAIPLEKIRANEYNPNSVAPPEMKLLYDSIKEDGYTMPIVCYYNSAEDMYEIVDGFHRYTIMLKHKDIYEREGGVIPVSVIDKPIDERMASTIRHNRARGSHNVDLMSNIITELNDLGRSNAWISKHLGMSLDEVIRLKQITGLVELFKDKDFSRSWELTE